ncbi:regulator of microtubule dynamics protein 2 isoform X4 [Acomys russatus]|uniref:regulator of microtubule dynamics protein 2 isoform X4 n=1 Tax=Acomys russatus TaxID=60746 RepID=UPI0021E33651|nr:regulator of microtubule dynamics protein 2 isoform X4 [Acomys russatus]
MKFSMGKCLSCWKEDQSFQPNCPEDQVPPQAMHHGASNILQLEGALDYIAYKTNRKLSSSSSVSGRLYLSKGRHSLLTRFRRKKRQQSRVNFDSQEDLTLNATRSSNLFSAVRAQCFSPSKLSVVSCYRNNIVYDTPQSSLNLSRSNKLQGLSKRSTNIHAQKRISFSDTKHGRKYFPKLETKAVSSSHWTVERASYPPSLTTSLFSLSTVISSSNQVSVADNSGNGHLSKDSDDALHHGSQSRSRDPSPADVELLSRNITSASLLHTRFPSPYKNISSLTVEVTSGPFEEESFPASPFDEAIPSPVELNEIRYITANTDTEDQSFPVPKAFNTHTEELKLDVLLQKVDHLRMNEADKMESFELLCDHKEKFSEEIEFLWRLARAYGDMYDLSTNTQEKKHYANIGKTLGERAITRAPMNGHCHLWYAVLCGHVSEFEGLQNKISCGHLFKEHLDIAIQLLPEEPLLYYLKGRYCYTVSKLSWIEKKMAATLFGEIPSSTIHEALLNFLKAEELQPGYSVSNYMYVAKCYADLEESQDASKFCNLALLLPIVTKEDKDAHKEVKKIICSLKR